MPSSLSDYKREVLEKRLSQLLEEYETVNDQFGRVLGDVERLRLKRQSEALEQEIDQVQAHLGALPGAPAAEGFPASVRIIHLDPENPPYAALRELLSEAFLPEELRRFCLDRAKFRPVVSQFGPGHGLDDMIDRLFDYCRTRLLWDDLVDGVAEVRAEQFARFALRLSG